eukprot:CAMPEP_0176495032 /NCGR_PEP_ID=MMETSP0200_2-20121128/10433_1 /TAXON_ID=947934 /ORGANISM="Chaetoceros sp., Strain GSL56" /LENGTH=585 /DNA_ID=CAMNT_0017892869 /DNA_START=1961 /DNA_END=3715 /DNA_ORIENTATION=-
MTNQDDNTEEDYFFPPPSSFLRVGSQLDDTTVRKSRLDSSRSSSSIVDDNQELPCTSFQSEEDDHQKLASSDSPSLSIKEVNFQENVLLRTTSRNNDKTNKGELNEIHARPPLSDAKDDNNIDEVESATLDNFFNHNYSRKENRIMGQEVNGVAVVLCLGFGLIWSLTVYYFNSRLRYSMDIQTELEMKIHDFILEKEELQIRLKDIATRGGSNYYCSMTHETREEQLQQGQPYNNFHGMAWLVNLFTSSGNPILFLVLGFCIMPIVIITVLDYWMDWIHRTRLSKLYNSRGEVIQATAAAFSSLPPFLPDEKYVPKESYDLILKYLMHYNHQRLGQQSRKTTEESSHLEQRKCWALVTGASRGIGRSIVISLARRDISIVLVARDKELLERLSKVVEDCYGVQTLVIASDLCQTNAAHDIALELDRNQIHVDILINNAGMGDTREFVTTLPKKINDLCQVNVTSITQLTQILGAKMKGKRAGRIAFVSSLAGAVPGVPHAAIYAAAKAYQKSLATSLEREMEGYGVGVTCIMPGAVRGTNFASNANMEDAVIWEFPFGILDPETVAECTVDAVILGRPMVIVGW